MATLGEEKYIFEVDWYDQQADITRKYQVVYLPVVKSIEMYDVKNKRIFLKRQEIPTLQLDDFYVGSQVTILSRVLKVTDYGDMFTRRSRTGFIAFINNAPVYWHSKKQGGIKTSSFSSEFMALKTCCEYLCGCELRSRWN